MEKLEFSGNTDFPHFLKKKVAANKLIKNLQKKQTGASSHRQIEDADLSCTPLSQADQKIIMVNKMNADPRAS